MNKRILIIDDEKIGLRPFQQELELAGYSVEIISDPSRCRDFITDPAAIKADLLIVDIMMPSRGLYHNNRTQGGLLTGLYLAADIRKMNHCTPILFWSAAILPEIVRQTTELTKILDDCAYLRNPIFCLMNW